jgi:hypothetical protein
MAKQEKLHQERAGEIKSFLKTDKNGVLLDEGHVRAESAHVRAPSEAAAVCIHAYTVIWLFVRTEQSECTTTCNMVHLC